MRAANDSDVEQLADEACAGLVSDLLADTYARLELLQRESWATELGLDPETADLCALPPVPPPDAWPDASVVVLRASGAGADADLDGAFAAVRAASA